MAKPKKAKPRTAKAKPTSARRPAAKSTRAPKPKAPRPIPSTIVPALRYRDAPAAIEFLCKAFGFKKHMVVPGADGIIEHAQLTLGNGMIMLGSVRDNNFGKLMTQPDEIDRTVTQSPYVIVAEIDAHYDRAKKAGAEIVMEIEDQDYGGRLYVARDPEGHVWNFGSYDPWQESGD